MHENAQGLDVAEVREHPKYGYRFAVVRGCGDSDHASWWTHDDEQIVRDRWWNPKPGEVVLDVGAAFGSYTLVALAAGARVVAFSPAPFDTRLLKTNLALNPALATRCLISGDGLHERDGYFDPDRNVFATSPVREADHDAGQWLRVRALDTWLTGHPGVDRVDLVKIDVEGGELGVLRGAAETLRRWRPRLLIELHEFHDKLIAEKVAAFLVPLGYAVDGPVQHCAVSHAFYQVRA